MVVGSRQQTYEACLAQAMQLLGVAGEGALLDGAMTAALRERAVLQRREGLLGHPLVLRLWWGTRGHCMALGMERYRLSIDGCSVPVVQIQNCVHGVGPLDDVWVFPREHYRRIYRWLRQQVRHREAREAVVPIMADDDRKRLWDNTVGFLRQGRELFERFGVAARRGVLLTGAPGNGKTMACRWLRHQCQQHGLAWRVITAAAFRYAHSEGELNSLFELDGPGIAAFDDFDLGMRDREEVGQTTDHSILLGALDGLDVRHGIVWMFTTNAAQHELDPAFRRRGRIDVVIEFPKPSADLRLRLVRELWPAEIVAAIDVDRVAAVSEGYSFAELDELKKLLVLGYHDQGRWDLDAALCQMETSQVQESGAGRIGFLRSTRRSPEPLPTEVPSVW